MKFEIFKTGSHTSDKGVTNNYSLEDLNFIAKSYNPDEDEAPIVVGHPADNSPAYGWISSIEVTEDGKLVADAPDDKIHPDFLTAVQEGRYKKRSISLTPDGKLRHVGFLGGAAPAVKGLADIQFSQPSSTVIEFDLDNQPEQVEVKQLVKDSDESSILTNITNQLNQLSETVSQLNNNFSDNVNLDLKSKFDTLSSEINSLKSRIYKSGFEDLLENKLGAGTLTPAIKDKILAVSDYAESQNFSTDFSQDKFIKDINSLLTDLVNSFPKIIHYENFAEKPEHDDSSNDEDFSGFTVDQESKALHKKALNLMKKDNISYLAAVKSLIAK